MFARPNGIKIDAALGKLLPLSTKQKYERMKQLTRTDDALFSLADKEAFKTRITEFGFYVKRINPYLMGVKSQIAQFLTSKQSTIVSYSELYKIVDRYEELNLNHYTDNQSS